MSRHGQYRQALHARIALNDFLSYPLQWKTEVVQFGWTDFGAIKV